MPKKSFRTAPTEVHTPRWARLLQARREKLGYSREGLALAAGVSPSLVAKLERGAHDIRDMSVGRLQALLRTLHLPSIEVLLGEGTAEEFAPSAPGVVAIPYYPALAPACVGEEAPSRSYLDTRLLPTRPSYTSFFLALLEREALRSEELQLSEGSVLVVERRAVLERGVTLLGFVEEIRRPLIFRLPSEARLVRPVGGTGATFWLLPDGSLQTPAGRKAAYVPVGIVHGEFRQP